MIRRRALNSFDLLGDGDDVEIVATTQETFGITLSAQELESVTHYGAFEDLVASKVRMGNDCLLHHAFHTFADGCGLPAGDCRPSTPLRRVFGRDPMAGDLEVLGEKVGLELQIWPRGTARPHKLIGAAVVVAMVGVALGLGFSADLILNVVVFLLIPALFFIADLWSVASAQRAPVPLGTVGDLLRACHGRNYRRLATRHGPGNLGDLRAALTGICRDETGYMGRVNRATTFYSNLSARGMP